MQAALFFGTASVGEVLNLGRLAVQGVTGAARMGAAAVKGALRVGTATMAKARTILKGPLARLGNWLIGLWNQLVAGLNRLLGRRVATEMAEAAARQTMVPRPPGGTGAAARGVRQVLNGKETSVDKEMKEDAQEHAETAWGAFVTKGDMMTVGASDDFLDENMGGTRGKDGKGHSWRLDATPIVNGDTWTVQVKAKGEGKEEKATAGKGWVAEGDDGDSLALKSAVKTNQDFAKDMVAHLEQTWNQRAEAGLPLDKEVMKGAFAKKAKDFTPLYDEMKLTFEDVAFKSTATEDHLTGEVQIAPNATQELVDLTAYKTEDKDFATQFPHAARGYFDEHVRAPWLTVIQDQLEKAGVGALRIDDAQFDACCGETFVKKVEEWFSKRKTETSKQGPWVERIGKYLRKNRSAFFGPLLDDLQNQVHGLLADDAHKDLRETCTQDEDAGILLLGDQIIGVTPALKAAVKNDVLAFLRGFIGSNTSFGISWKDFQNPNSPNGFGFRDAAGQLSNSGFIKAEFRKISKGSHEWIPCNKIPDVVKRDVDEATKAQEVKEETKEWMGWVALQNTLRTPTVDIIFKPTVDKAELSQELGKYMRGETVVETPAPEQATAEAQIEEGQGAQQSEAPRTIEGYARQLKATRFGLCGHSGALYVAEEGKAKPQTKGQGGFHDLLRDAFDEAQTPAAYITALEKVIDDELWNGTVDFLPEELQPHQELIKMGYTGADAVTATDDNLRAFGQRIDRGFKTLTGDVLGLKKVLPK